MLKIEKRDSEFVRDKIKWRVWLHRALLGGVSLIITLAIAELVQKNFFLFHPMIPQIVSWIFVGWTLITIVLFIIDEYGKYKKL